MSAEQPVKRERFSRFTQEWVPEDYQITAVEWLLSHNCAGLFADPGLGKTSVTLSAIEQLQRERLLKRTLVVAPLRVCELVWPAEGLKWRHLNRLRMTNLSGPRMTPKRRLAALDSDAHIFLVNPENLGWLLGEDNLHLLDDYDIDTLVVDESTKFKAYNTVRFDLMRYAVAHFTRRWILTGTPKPNGYQDLFGQIFIVDEGRALGRFVTQYRKRWFHQKPWDKFNWHLNAGADLEINDAIAPYILRLDEADYLTLPPVKENPIWVELPADARKIYDDMEADLVTSLKEETIVAANAAAASTSCRQITGGALYNGKPRNAGLPIPETFEILHTEKIDALKDLHESMGDAPLMVLYQFKHELWRLQKEFPKASLLGENLKNDKLVEGQWNRGEIPMLLAHPTSIAHGLNLQGSGNALCWFSDTWNAEEYEQTIRRLRRRGTKHSVIFSHHIVARDTIDEVMLLVVQQKRRDEKVFLEAMKKYFNEGV